MKIIEGYFTHDFVVHPILISSLPIVSTLLGRHHSSTICSVRHFHKHIRDDSQSLHLAAPLSFDIYFGPILRTPLLAPQLLSQCISLKDFPAGDPPKGYPGSNVGPEPTTDRFVAITGGSSDRIMPGNAAAVNPNMPFTGLQVPPPS